MVEIRCVMLGSGMEVEDFVSTFAKILGAGENEGWRRIDAAKKTRRSQEGSLDTIGF